MEMNLERINQKPHDYKICLECGKLNWYENENCVGCNHSGFDETERLVNDSITDEYKFYNSEGYTEEEIDNIYIDV